MIKIITVLLIITFVSVGASQNYKQVRIILNSKNDIALLQKQGLEFDHPHLTKKNALEVFLNDSEFEILKNSGFQYEILIDDWYSYYSKFQKLNNEEKQRLVEDSYQTFGVSGFHLGSMGGYMTLAEAYAELDTLKKLFPSLITTKLSLGNSIENRPIYMAKISDNPDIDENEPEVLYTALHHAREPESMMQMFYFMYYLLENYYSDPAVQYLVNNRELYFIPVVNPDGYEYNRITNPSGGGMWRKNRRANVGSFGVDLNRNYGPDIYWNAPNGGSSTVPSSDTYRGAAPFSEPETQIIKNFLAARKIKTALNYHTFGNYLIFPYGALAVETPDSLTFREFAHEMTQFNEYAYGTDMQTVGYSTRGNSDDYFYDGDTISNGGKIFAMTPEVGNSSDYFWPPENRIFPLAQENLYPNLYYAWVAGEYISLDNPNFAKDYFSPGETVEFYPAVKNKGLSTGYDAHVLLTASDLYITINNGFIIIDSLESRKTEISSLPFSFSISPSTPPEAKVNLVFTTSIQGAVMSSDTVSIFIGKPEYVFADFSINPLDNWSITSLPAAPFWESTTSTFYSLPSCFTDSKAGNYANNATVTMTLRDSLDLTGYNNPFLTFWTKFDIESNWDYGQVKISSDNGISWVPLAGNYTNSGIGSYQPNGQPLYDGVQSSWVKEEMSLSGFTSHQVKIRFELKSDASETRDGWYVDDIGIFVYKAVPVELISFSGKAEGSKIELNWQTVTELNNYGFEIERASSTTTTIHDWEKIGFVLGSGNSSKIKSYSYIDNKHLIAGNYLYRLKQIDFDGSYKYSNEIEIEINPTQFSLEQNYPNPFNPSTKIRYSIPANSKSEKLNVVLKIFDVLGREVVTLVNEEKLAGIYEVEYISSIDGNQNVSGVYFYRLKAGSFVETKKMLLLQ